MEGLGCGDRFARIIFIALKYRHSYITGDLIHAFNPTSHLACCPIFSNRDNAVLYAVSRYQTARLSLGDGSVTPFNDQNIQDRYCHSESMALNGDGTVLFVAYCYAKCVVALSTETLQMIWKTDIFAPQSISYHNEYVFVGCSKSHFMMLSAEDGHVVRTLAAASSAVLGHSVFPGLQIIESQFLIL